MANKHWTHHLVEILAYFDGCKMWWIPTRDCWEISYFHREVLYPIERVTYFELDGKDVPRFLFNKLMGIKKEIDYYLDAIWC